MAHTPGPWEARTFMVMGGAGMRDRICHFGSSTSLPPSRSNETFANAALCAAAPELLDVAREYLAAFDAQGFGNDTPWTLKLRAAVYKAEGLSV